MILRFHWPETGLKSELPLEPINCLKNATLDKMRLRVELIEEPVISNIMQSPYQSDPPIGLQPSVHLLVAFKDIVLLATLQTLIRIVHLHDIDLFTFLVRRLQGLVILQLNHLKVILLLNILQTFTAISGKCPSFLASRATATFIRLFDLLPVLLLRHLLRLDAAHRRVLLRIC